jgi:predicted esterase
MHNSAICRKTGCLKKPKAYYGREMHPVLVSILLLLFSALAFSQQAIPKGEIVDPVTSALDPTLSHAIYLPSSYTPEKKWPILYCYEARKRGRLPVELFRQAAERLGWIIVGSNDTESDNPNDRNLDALKAMWSDSHKWFSIDESRIYTTGFSGGARLAWGMGYIFPESTAGVIGVGAGAHEERRPTKDTPFVWYGIAGKTDYNYLEMRRLEDRLDELEIPNRVEFFDGSHEWPPAEYCSRALDWMELQAMKKGLRAKDDAWIGEQYEGRLEEANKLRDSSKSFEAYLQYVQLQEDFNGLLDTSSLENQLSSLANSAAIKKQLEERKKREEKEEKQVAALFQTLGAFRNGSEIPLVRRLKADLKIADFQKQSSEKGDSHEGLLFKRLLATLFSEVGFYLPQYFLQQKDYNRAIVSLSVAAEIYPESPFVWYNLAAVHSEHGDKEKSLDNLKTAIARGFKNRKWIDQDKSFDPIRNDPAFQQVLSTIPTS